MRIAIAFLLLTTSVPGQDTELGLDLTDVGTGVVPEGLQGDPDLAALKERQGRQCRYQQRLQYPL